MRRITQLFVNRPPLVFVLVAVIALAGSFSLATLVQQQFPNIDFPTVSVSVSYPGASPSELRDAVVRPIEDAIAGAPDLSYINTSIQQNQASISATFSLDSNQTTDLTEVQDRVQTASAALPSDLPAPSVRTFDPAQATVVTLSVTSQSLSMPGLSAIVTNNLVPALEQVSGISYVGANGTVTPALEVLVDPEKLQARGFTTDRRRHRDSIEQRARAGWNCLHREPRDLARHPRGRADAGLDRKSAADGLEFGLARGDLAVGDGHPKILELERTTNQALSLSNSNTTLSSAATSGNAAAAEAGTTTTLAGAGNAASSSGGASSNNASSGSGASLSSLPSGNGSAGLPATPTPSPLTASATVATTVVSSGANPATSSTVTSAKAGTVSPSTPVPTIAPLVYTIAPLATGTAQPAASPPPAATAFVPAPNANVAASVPANYSALTPASAGWARPRPASEARRPIRFRPRPS